MKGRYKRFVGDGNSWVGDDRKIRAWQVTCRRCSAQDSVNTYANNPESVWRILERRGWRLGRDSSDDECRGCVQARKAEDLQAREGRREERRENLSLADVVGELKLPQDEVDRGRLAAAVLVDGVMRERRSDITDALELVQLALRYSALTEDRPERRRARTCLKVAAFGERQFFKPAVAELRGLLAAAERSREEPPPSLRTSVSERPTPAERFAGKFGGVTFNGATRRPDPPVPAVEPVETSPVVVEASSGVTAVDVEAEREEPGWLRAARARMTPRRRRAEEEE